MEGIADLLFSFYPQKGLVNTYGVEREVQSACT